MIRVILFALALQVTLLAQPLPILYDWIIPDQVRKCLTNGSKRAKTQLRPNMESNPFYLRGDFDGDGQMDLAVAVRGHGEEEIGVVLCAGSFNITVLGSIAKGVFFSDIPGDRIMSLGWCVLRKAEILDILASNNPRRHDSIRRKIPVIRGEMLFFPAEDGMGMIYFLDGRYRWYTINSVMLPQ